MVIDPTALLDEIDRLRDRGIDVARTASSCPPRATLILPTHRALDLARESARGAGKIGTTGRGIGPAYATRPRAAAAAASPTCSRPRPARGAAARASVAEHNRELSRCYGAEPLDVDGADRRASTAAAAAPRRRCLREPRPPARAPCDARRAASSSRARRGRCSTSTTAPTPSSPPRLPPAGGRLRPAPASAPACSAGHRRQGLHHPRRRRPVPDRAQQDDTASTSASAATSTAPPPAGRAAAAGSTPSPAATPCDVAGIDAARADQARRPRRLRRDRGRDRLRAPDGKPSTVPADPSCSRGPPATENLPGWSGSTAGVTDEAALPAAAREYVAFLEEQLGVPVVLVSTGHAARRPCSRRLRRRSRRLAALLDPGRQRR